MVQNVPDLWTIPVEATHCLRLFQTCFLHFTHWLLPPVTTPVAQTKQTSVNFCRMRPLECSGTIKLDTTGIPPLYFRFLSSKANALSRWVKLESCMSISFPRNWKLTHYVQDWFSFFFFKCWQVKSSQCKKSTSFTRACSFLVISQPLSYYQKRELPVLWLRGQCEHSKANSYFLSTSKSVPLLPIQCQDSW